jgi:hypothetical protein
LPAALAGAIDVDLADLAANRGRLVRAGGVVLELNESGFMLDDGTARRPVSLTGAAHDYADLIEPGDVLNAIGTVEDGPGGLRIVVRDAAGIVLAADLGSDPAQGSGGPGLSPSPDGAATGHGSGGPGTTGSQSAGLGGGLPTEPTLAGLVTLALISLASVGVTVWRRRRTNRLLAARVAARLEAVVRHPAPVTEAPQGGPGS